MNLFATLVPRYRDAGCLGATQNGCGGLRGVFPVWVLLVFCALSMVSAFASERPALANAVQQSAKPETLASLDAGITHSALSFGRVLATEWRAALLDTLVGSNELLCESNPSVENNNDSGPGSLRQALADACAGSTITFDPSFFGVPRTITLETGQLSTPRSVRIEGPGRDLLTISGNNASKIFSTLFIGFGLSGMTLTEGNGVSPGANAGGLVLINGGTIDFSDMAFTNSVCTSTSAGVSAAGAQGSIQSSVFSGLNCNNVSAIYLQNSEIDLFDLTVTGNSGSEPIRLNATGSDRNILVRMVNVTISGNSSAPAFWPSALTLEALSTSTMTVELINSTISGNDEPNTNGRGAIWLRDDQTGTKVLRLTNTIVAGNTRQGIFEDIRGTVHPDSSHNLIGIGGGLLDGVNGNQVGITDPLLAPLADYGGPLPTRALLPGSPAIDAGTASNAPATDQRGVARVGAVDIGAFESRGFGLTLESGDNQAAVVGTAFAEPLIVGASSAFDEPVDGGEIAFIAPDSAASLSEQFSFATIASGKATLIATANAQVGEYVVSAGASGSDDSLEFGLTNLPEIFEVTASVASGLGEISPGSQSVTAGHTASWLVTAETGWSLLSVNGDSCTPELLSESEWQATNIQANCVVEASFEAITHTVTPSAGANGAIAPDTPQIVNQGDSTSFTITPDANFQIAGVSGCDGTLAGDLYTTGAITSDCSVEASFEAITHTVTPTAGANGAISPDTPQTVNQGDSASFTVTADANFQIASVSGCDGSLVGDTYTTGAIVAECSVEASFEAITHTVTPSAGANGAITPDTPQIVNQGDSTSFTVTADANFQIASVSGCDGSLVGDTYTTGAIVAECSVEASFEAITHTITPTAGANGAISPDSPQTVNQGDSASFTVTADANFQIASVSGCDGTLAGDLYTTGAITSDCSVEASFEAITHTVTPNAGANGAISPDSPQTVNQGDSTSFTITPDANFQIASVSGCDGTLAGDIYTTGAITADCSVEVSFEADTALQVLAGSGQVAALGSAFAQPLLVRVTTPDGVPVADVEVAFSVPASGASAVLAASSGVSNAQGVVLMQASANLEVGSYQVQAFIPALDAVAPISFSLENTAGELVLTPSIDAGREYARYGQTVNYLVRVKNEGSDAVFDLDVQVALSDSLDEASATWLCLTPLSGCTQQGSGALSQSGLQLQAGDTLSFLYSVPVRLRPSEHEALADLFIEAGGEQGIVLATPITLVVFRNGYDAPYADGAQALPDTELTAQRGELAEDQLLELAIPASTLGHGILWQSQPGAALPVRVEQFCTVHGCWLRIVTSESGAERISPWAPWQGAAVPLLSHSTWEDYDELLLDAGDGMVALRIRRDRG